MPNDPVRIKGTSGYVAEVTDKGEVWTTVTERENDVWVSYGKSAVAATAYVIMVDRDGLHFPHKLQGQGDARVDCSMMDVVVDAGVSTQGRLKLGIVTRVDGVNADIKYFIDFPFEVGKTGIMATFKATPSQLKSDSESGVLQHGLTNVVENGVAAVNTGVALDSPRGAATVIPAVGDIIAKLEFTGGTSYNVFMTLFYHAH